MEAHYGLTDTEFEQQFKDCTLPSSVFTHEAHLRLAWTYIHHYGIDKAIEQICHQLQKYVERLGAKDKYNETVTIAGTRAVYHFMLHSKTNNFKDFINENSRLKIGRASCRERVYVLV